MITTTITTDITNEQLLTLLNENGFTGQKPSYDEDGQPILNEDGTPKMETMQPEEYLSYIVKELCIMPLVRHTTSSLQEKRGSLAYPAKQMAEVFSSKITVESVID